MTDIITRHHTALDGKESFAIYSPCEKYRYVLERRWGPSEKTLVMIMLNPSTATELQNDPTVERCERRARMWGFDKMHVLNIFAYRATDPQDMRSIPDPVGLLNDEYIGAALKLAKSKGDVHQVVCGWGTHGEHLARGDKVLKMVLSHGLEPQALKWTSAGHPGHPLYIGYKEVPKVRAA